MYRLGNRDSCTLQDCTGHWHCHLYRVQRGDGSPPLRFSTLDRPFMFRRERYVPTAGERLDEAFAASMERGDTELIGALSPRTITPVDVQLGIYDDAKIDQFVVDWRREKLYLHQEWWIDELTHDGRVWRAALSSSARFLQIVKGEVYDSICPAVLGDERCRKVVADNPGTVTSVLDTQMHFESTLAVGSGILRIGTIDWLTGNNAGTRTRVLANNSVDGEVQLAVPTRFSIIAGDTFTARPGCDGLATTCKNVHNNLVHFQGNQFQRNAKQLILSRGTVG